MKILLLLLGVMILWAALTGYHSVKLVVILSASCIHFASNGQYLNGE